MMTSPKTSATPTVPSAPWYCASDTTAPQPANTRANVARPSAAGRRASPGRSGNALDGDADDRQPAGQARERERAKVVLRDSQQRGCITVARKRQRRGD